MARRAQARGGHPGAARRPCKTGCHLFRAQLKRKHLFEHQYATCQGLRFNVRELSNARMTLAPKRVHVPGMA